MSQQELLARLARALEAMGIPFMLTGSVAGNFLGHPRTTHDIDVVVDLAYKHVEPLLQAFPPPRYYLDADATRQAIAQGQMVNLLDTETGDKIDFWMLHDRPFDAERFARRRKIQYADTHLYVSTAEDLILKKLEFASELGGSEKQTADATAIAKYHRGQLDLEYLARWADRLRVRDAWSRVRHDAGID